MKVIRINDGDFDELKSHLKNLFDAKKGAEELKAFLGGVCTVSGSEVAARELSNTKRIVRELFNAANDFATMLECARDVDAQ